jgi:hypothetical protein
MRDGRILLAGTTRARRTCRTAGSAEGYTIESRETPGLLRLQTVYDVRLRRWCGRAAEQGGVPARGRKRQEICRAALQTSKPLRS